MEITKISATSKILFYTDSKADGPLNLTCFSPAYKSNRVVHTVELEYSGCQYECERFVGEYDIVTSRFVVTDADGNVIGGKKYVEDINISNRDFDYPTPSTKKCLQVLLL